MATKLCGRLLLDLRPAHTKLVYCVLFLDRTWFLCLRKEEKMFTPPYISVRLFAYLYTVNCTHFASSSSSTVRFHKATSSSHITTLYISLFVLKSCANESVFCTFKSRHNSKKALQVIVLRNN